MSPKELRHEITRGATDLKGNADIVHAPQKQWQDVWLSTTPIASQGRASLLMKFRHFEIKR